jgi:endonuclease YncB( thermonuclease family)
MTPRGHEVNDSPRGHPDELLGNRGTLLGDRTHDQYGRLLAEVILPDGRSLVERLVRAGLA